MVPLNQPFPIICRIIIYTEFIVVEKPSLPGEYERAVIGLQVSLQPCLHISHDQRVLWLIEDLM